MGPIAFAIITKGFNGEIKEGLAIGTGAAFMDFLYCFLAFGGISLIISLIPTAASDFYRKYLFEIQIVLTFVGCVVVVFYGIKIIRAKITYGKMETKESSKLNVALERAGKLEERAKSIVKNPSSVKPDPSNKLGLFFMGVLLTLSSLTVFASWVALIGYLKGFNFLSSSFWGGLLFSIGAFIGTYLWFYVLLQFICGNRKRINQETVNVLNVIAGVILIGLGVFLFVKAVIAVSYA